MFTLPIFAALSLLTNVAGVVAVSGVTTFNDVGQPKNSSPIRIDYASSKFNTQTTVACSGRLSPSSQCCLRMAHCVIKHRFPSEQ